MIRGILDTIGNTPLVPLLRLFSPQKFRLYAKLESVNPGGSIKDRAALTILRNALEAGLINTDSTIVESSSGNMGIGLAMATSYLGIRFVCVVDPRTTAQNVNILRIYGADVEMVQKPDPVSGEYLPARIARVRALLKTIPNSFWPNQYANYWNAQAHHTTFREIARDLGEFPDVLLCATSTCGTLRGCSDCARLDGAHTRIVAVDSVGSIIFGGPPSKRLIPGMGAAIRPQLFAEHLADDVINVTDWECVVGCHRLVEREAILAGGSSGGVVAAIDRLKSELKPASTCVAILCDRGERYIDTIYSNEWVRDHFPGCHLDNDSNPSIPEPAASEVVL